MDSYAVAIDFLKADNSQDSIDSMIERIKDSVDEETYQMLIDYYDKKKPVNWAMRVINP